MTKLGWDSLNLIKPFLESQTSRGQKGHTTSKTSILFIEYSPGRKGLKLTLLQYCETPTSNRVYMTLMKINNYADNVLVGLFPSTNSVINRVKSFCQKCYSKYSQCKSIFCSADGEIVRCKQNKKLSVKNF